MRAILFVIGGAVTLAGVVLCGHVLGTGEGNPLTALATLGLGVLLMAPGWPAARDTNWPRR